MSELVKVEFLRRYMDPTGNHAKGDTAEVDEEVAKAFYAAKIAKPHYPAPKMPTEKQLAEEAARKVETSVEADELAKTDEPVKADEPVDGTPDALGTGEQEPSGDGTGEFTPVGDDL